MGGGGVRNSQIKEIQMQNGTNQCHMDPSCTSNQLLGQQEPYKKEEKSLSLNKKKTGELSGVKNKKSGEWVSSSKNGLDRKNRTR